jgi:hypothetical protein
MTTLSRHMLPLAAIALIGLAGSSVAAFAQAPKPAGAATNGPITPVEPFQCRPGESAFKTGNGTNDNFAGTADPKPHPSAAFASAVTLVPATNIYDQTASNYHFGDTFTLNPPGQITKVRLTTRLKANSGDANNDGISFSTSPSFTPGHFGFALNTLSPGWGTSGSGQMPKLFMFEFEAGSTVQVNVAGNPSNTTPSPYSSSTFYGDLNTNHLLHVYVEDDTSVDFVEVELCYQPAPKYDLVAAKKHDGNIYTLNVHNAGSPIMPTGSVQVVEVVPAGLTIDWASMTGWQCPGAVFPVVGPDAFTCNYQIPAGGIAANANLPPIVLKTEGTPECPNCMRARLFLKSVSEGSKPVDEGDMKNNVSCTK